ncbi:hypothetical protein [Nonomuraea sp. NPDC050691]|uniref:hypothetical protein n=1 Tax=Nonomuraea sp. NPDC050691 TaxID=3155661 RepID=UPI0033EC2BDE
MPFAGVSLAAAAPAKDPARTTTATHAPKDQAVKAQVTPGKVAAGDAYKVTVFAKGVRPGATATVRSPQGATYKATLNDGRAANGDHEGGHRTPGR